MSASSNALSKTLKKQSMEEKVVFISQTLGLEAKNLWRLYGLYKWGSSALMNAEASKAGAANAFLDTLYYALTTKDEPLTIERLQKFHSLLYRFDSSMKPGELRTALYYQKFKSTPYQYFTNNKRLRKSWFTLTQGQTSYVQTHSQNCPVPSQSYFEKCFSEYALQMKDARKPTTKLEIIVSLIYALGLTQPFETQIIDPLTVLFIQLLHENQLDLGYLLNLDLSLNTDSLDHVLQIIKDYPSTPVQSLSAEVESTLWEKADLEKNSEGLIHWSVTSTSPLHQSFFNELIKRYPDSINSTDKFGNTPLINACFYNNLMAVQTLLAQPGIIPNQSGQHGYSAYYWALRLEHRDIIALLKPRMEQPIDSEKPKENHFQAVSKHVSFGLHQPFKRQEFCQKILLQNGNGESFPLDSLQQAQNWVALETLRHLEPDNELLTKFNCELPDKVLHPFNFNRKMYDLFGSSKSSSDSFAKCKKLAQNLAHRPAIIDSIFDNYEFFCRTKPESYARDFDLSHYDSTQDLHYKRFANFVICKGETALFLRKDKIAPAIYHLFFNELFSRNGFDIIFQQIINSEVYPHQKNKEAFLRYLKTASEEQLTIFFNYIVTERIKNGKSKDEFNLLISQDVRIGCSFLRYLLTQSSNEIHLFQKTIDVLVLMKPYQLKLLLDLAIDHFKASELDKIFATVLTRRQMKYHFIQYNGFDSLFSDPRIIECIQGLLNRSPKYLSNLSYNIKNEDTLEKLFISNLSTIPLLDDNNELSTEARDRLVKMLSWDMQSYRFYTNIFDCFISDSLKNQTQREHYFPNLQGPVARAFLLFLLSDEAFKRYGNNENILSYSSNSKTINRIAQVVATEPEKNHMPAFLSLLGLTLNENPWQVKQLLALYTEIKLRRFPEESELNAFIEYYVAMMSSSSFFKTRGAICNLEHQEIEEIYKTVVSKQSDAFQQKCLENLVCFFGSSDEFYDKENYYNRIINHPIFYEMLITQFSVRPSSTSLVNFIHSCSRSRTTTYADNFCNYLFSDQCMLSDQLKLTAFFKLPPRLINTYFPILQPKIRSNIDLKNQLMKILFDEISFYKNLLNGNNITNKPTFLLEFLKWIKVNHPTYFIERVERQIYINLIELSPFPEDLVEQFIAVLNPLERIQLVNMINHRDDPEFKAWIDESPALSECFDRIMHPEPAIPCSSRM